MRLNEARKKLGGEEEAGMDDDFINRTRLNNDIRGVRTIAIKNVKNKIICRRVMGIDDKTMLEGHKNWHIGV